MDVGAVLDAAGLKNPHVWDYVVYWVWHTAPAAVEVVAVDDDARLLAEAVAAGEIHPAGEGQYYARSHGKDTGDSQRRTFVATGNLSDIGVYNNWRPAGVAPAEDRMRGASAGKTMYVVPYLMAQPGSPLEPWAAGVQLTDSRTVVLQMLRMTRVGVHHVNHLAEPDGFVRAVHVTGDLDRLGQGTRADRRLFVTVPERRTILHFGSAHGDNAVLCRIAHGLRQAGWDGLRSGRFVAGRFTLLGITDKLAGRRYHVCGAFPAGSGRTNLSTLSAPDESARWQLDFYGDTIAWLWVDHHGRLRAMNPEFGACGLVRDTTGTTDPAAMQAGGPGTPVLFTDVAHNEFNHQMWWEGRTPHPPVDATGWRDWTGGLISARPPEGTDLDWAHPNSRFTTTSVNMPNLAADFADPDGVPVDAIVFGSRTARPEPLIRAITDLAEGIYDGLTLGTDTTLTAENKDDHPRYDPMAMRPFLSYPEADLAAHWLRIIGAAREKPIFAHLNWYAPAVDGRSSRPAHRDDLRPLLWLLALKNGEVTGRQTPVGILPTPDELDLTGMTLPPDEVQALLSVDLPCWQQEMAHRQVHLEQFTGLPEQIWAAHHRVAAGLHTAVGEEYTTRQT